MLLLAIGLVLVAAGVAGAAIAAGLVGNHRARAAADLGALAGAGRAIYGAEVACARAGQLVTANGGRLTGCTVTGLEVVVAVAVDVRPLPGLLRRATAAARAGPVYAVDGRAR
ncbi:helicase [Actinoplanes sp. TBRC 11911]|nr:helicase [Actinoplanes sp. TBRC 11911]